MIQLPEIDVACSVEFLTGWDVEGLDLVYKVVDSLPKDEGARIPVATLESVINSDSMRPESTDVIVENTNLDGSSHTTLFELFQLARGHGKGLLTDVEGAKLLEIMQDSQVIELIHALIAYS